ncbi:MAG: 3-oxoacyl-ACP reductase FabG [Verrucomicrobia bacterium]|nr:3-oxoacyl-ACP reductase FabG [Verrucomicrobiota bacterium]MBS0636808.1 3-oxoacyl-ACP reductase FabG [Verrucomicrobiota bacterium]
MNQLKDQVAFITGATAGIGKAIAQSFVAAGAHVIALGTNQERGQELEKESNGKITFMQVDVSNKEQVEKAVEATLAKFQKIDILVNNAGITRDGLLMRMTDEDWERVLDVNMTSAFYTTRAMMRPFMKAKRGKIINVSSVVGLIGNPGQTNYAASKGALISFSKSLAKEVASRNITVNCIAPGYIDTNMTDKLPEAKRAEVVNHIPLGRMGRPEDIASACLFLASPAADYITGQVLVVDGGLAM